MKKFRFLLAMLALVLVVGLAFVGCKNGTEDGNIDANKLIGLWKNETTDLYIKFSALSPDGNMLKVEYAPEAYLNMLDGNVGFSELQGDVIYVGTFGTFRVAFEGQKLRVYEATNYFLSQGLNGLYTKQ